MSKRVIRPVYAHNGFAMRSVKLLSSGAELLHCVERKTTIQCGSLGRRETDGSISITKPHAGHMPDDDKVKAKLARIEIKEIAQTSELAPRDILHVAKIKYGDQPVVEAGSVSTIKRMISRQRKRCIDFKTADSIKSVSRGETAEYNEEKEILRLDSICEPINGTHVTLASSLQFDTLDKSETVSNDGNLEVAKSLLEQLWSIHTQNMSEPSAKRARTTDEVPNCLSEVSEPVKQKIMELDGVQFDLDNLNEKAAEEILLIEQKYNKLRQPHYQKRKALIQAIPSFWQTAFLNHHLLSTAIPEEQEELLSQLKDLEVEEFDDIKSGYKIKMTFEKNNFFDNEVVIKTYHLNTENPNSTTSEIAWKANKKPQTDKDSSDTQITFLEWLSSNIPPDSDEIAEVIKDDLFPNPLQYFIMPDMQDVTDEDLEEFDEEDEAENGEQE